MTKQIIGYPGYPFRRVSAEKRAGYPDVEPAPIGYKTNPCSQCERLTSFEFPFPDDSNWLCQTCRGERERDAAQARVASEQTLRARLEELNPRYHRGELTPVEAVEFENLCNHLF